MDPSRADGTPPGKSVLVPLTSSLYVPGNLADVERVVVDVGTGYYVKKVGVYDSAMRPGLCAPVSVFPRTSPSG
jgi:prefoldin alpha subunit